MPAEIVIFRDMQSNEVLHARTAENLPPEGSQERYEKLQDECEVWERFYHRVYAGEVAAQAVVIPVSGIKPETARAKINKQIRLAKSQQMEQVSINRYVSSSPLFMQDIIW